MYYFRHCSWFFVLQRSGLLSFFVRFALTICSLRSAVVVFVVVLLYAP
ncbi:MAG: hypothetical protein KBS77_06165 [Bacteroidales bacterium]|nr:hypothetical protein [Candidatus Colicola faecequi]